MKVRIITFFSILLILNTFQSFTQTLNWDWSKYFGTSSAHKRAVSEKIRTDSEGNVYTLIHTRDDFQIDTEIFDMEELDKSLGNFCTAVVKTNAKGDLIWVKCAEYIEASIGFEIDKNDIIHVLTLRSHQIPTLEYHYSKYDKNWNLLSTRKLANTVNLSSSYQEFPNVEVDNSSNYYLGFRADGTKKWVLEGDTLDLFPDFSYFIAKYNQDDILQWWTYVRTRDLGSISFDVSQTGEVFLIGTYRQDLYVKNNTIVKDEPGFMNSFCIKFDTNGNIDWTKRWGNMFSDDFVNDIVIHNNQVYLAGTFGRADYDIFGQQFSVGLDDPYVLILDGQGNYQNLIKLPINYSEAAGRVIDVAENGNIIFGGQYSGFQPETGEQILPGVHSTEIFVALINPWGEICTVETAYGVGVDNLSDIVFIDNKRIAATGFFNCDLNIDDNTMEKVDCFLGNSYDSFISIIDVNETSDDTEVPNMITNIFPNPTQGQFTLELSEDLSTKNLFYEVLNPQNVVLQKGKITSTNFPITLQSFPDGVYVLKVYNKNQVAFGKIVVE